MNQHSFENAPDGAWDDSVFSPLPGEGKAFIAPRPAPSRRWPLFAALVVMTGASAAWWLSSSPQEDAPRTAPAPVQEVVALPALPPAPRITTPAKSVKRVAVAPKPKPAVKKVEVNQARSFGPTP